MRTLIMLALLTAVPAALEAQTLARRIAAAPDGTVLLSAPARPGVCGNGRNISIRRSDDDWEPDCEEGPVRLALEVRDGRVTRIRAHVGGRWRRSGVTDLGMQEPEAVADLLLAIAERTDGPGEDAIFPVTILAGVTPWPRLFRIARNEELPGRTRRGAVFWLGQGAAQAATALLDTIASSDGDTEVRKAAVFALSQRPNDEGVPALIRLARTHRDPEVRRSAIFWLGQSEDPRALALFEELLAE